MMRISSEQLAAFQPGEAQRFVERTARRLREHFPEIEAMTDARLFALVHLGMERARGHGLHTARQISLYTGLMVHLGQDFDRDGSCAWAAEILENSTISSSTRLAMLYERAETTPESGSSVGNRPPPSERTAP